MTRDAWRQDKSRQKQGRQKQGRQQEGRQDALERDRRLVALWKRGLLPPRGRLVQTSGIESTGSVDVKVLFDDPKDVGYIDWEMGHPQDVSIDKYITVTQNGRHCLTDSVRIGIIDGVLDVTRPPAAHYRGRVMLTVGRTLGHISPHSEWLWPGLSPLQVSLCKLARCPQSHDCEEDTDSRFTQQGLRNASVVGARLLAGATPDVPLPSLEGALSTVPVLMPPEPKVENLRTELSCITGRELFDAAGTNVSLAFIISYWNNAEWIRAPLSQVLSRMSLNELLGVFDRRWSEEWAKKDRIVRCQIRPGSYVSGTDFQVGDSCSPYLEKVVTSKLVKNAIFRLLTYHSKRCLLQHAVRSVPGQLVDRYALGAFARIKFHREGLYICANGVDLSVPPGCQFVYGQIPIGNGNPSVASTPVCYVSTSDDSLDMVMLYKKNSIAIQVATCFAKKDGSRFDSFGPFTEDDLDYKIYVRLACRYNPSDALNLINDSRRPKRTQVLLIGPHDDRLVTNRSLGPRLKSYLGSFICNGGRRVDQLF
ncbi:hypothetical protein GNI_082420 [Gregarina niphandrodes]|uniref:Uncharacterized protein n=1 Tax=Gregarina niphandrodes TaxID=110365 RepID=A0A023B652_GRENI|nr:hypothetical protein GNI_082420 [Gregarina niphandrodes]EZG65670.1 hypothetical protein GNI_082420 [Gregarina niphandrodes]|eukprot:XP_011134063.1 hypothetical protein GNI_082420 [Gregarina niphandrodes]